MAPRKMNPSSDSYERPGLASSVHRLNWITLGWLAIFISTFCGICVEGFLLAATQLAVELPFLIAWLLAGAGYGSLIVRRAVADATPLLLAVTVTALGIGVMSLIILGLGLAGWLSRSNAAGIVIVGIALLLFTNRATLRSGTIAALKSIALDGDDRLWPLLLTAPVAAFGVVCALLPAGVLWPGEPNRYDVIEYHLQVPREWFELHRIVPLDHNVFSYFPMNVEVQYLLAMYLRGGPWNGVYLAQLMHCAMVMLSVVAVFAVVYDLRRSTASAALAALLAATAPWLCLLAPIAYNDGAQLLFGTLALGWLLRARAGGITAAAVAGAFAGLACGSKLTAVAEILFAFPLALLLTSISGIDDRPIGKRSLPIRAAVVFVVVGLLVLSPWLARNAVWAGNPVFPEAAKLLGRGHFTSEQVQRWDDAYQPSPDERGFVGHVRALFTQVGIFGSLPLATFGYALPILFVWLLIVWVRDRRQSALAFCLLASIVILVLWLGFTHLQGRFLAILIPIVAIGVAICERPLMLRRAAIVLACISTGLGGIGLGMRFQSLANDGIEVVGLFGFEPNEFYRGIKKDELQAVPADQLLALVGDARGYFYERPMSLLQYRTVFDVDTPGAKDAVAAWLGGTQPPYILIDPAEIRRLSKSYIGIPPLPESLASRVAANQPFIITSMPGQ